MQEEGTRERCTYVEVLDGDTTHIVSTLDDACELLSGFLLYRDVDILDTIRALSITHYHDLDDDNDADEEFAIDSYRFVVSDNVLSPTFVATED